MLAFLLAPPRDAFGEECLTLVLGDSVTSGKLSPIRCAGRSTRGSSGSSEKSTNNGSSSEKKSYSGLRRRAPLPTSTRGWTELGRRIRHDAAGNRSSSMARLPAVLGGERPCAEDQLLPVPKSCPRAEDPGACRCGGGGTRRGTAPTLPHSRQPRAFSAALWTRDSTLWNGSSVGCASTGLLKLAGLPPGIAVEARQVVEGVKIRLPFFAAESSDALAARGGRALKKLSPDKPAA